MDKELYELVVMADKVTITNEDTGEVIDITDQREAVAESIAEASLKERLKEYWEEETKSSPEDELRFWEKMKSDERLDASSKLAIEERIEELKDLQK